MLAFAAVTFCYVNMNLSRDFEQKKHPAWHACISSPQKLFRKLKEFSLIQMYLYNCEDIHELQYSLYGPFRCWGSELDPPNRPWPVPHFAALTMFLTQPNQY